MTTPPTIERAAAAIREELERHVATFEEEGKLLEAHRLRQRTEYDLEMMQELGYCNGIENYSRVLDGRAPGQAPFTLLDYFPGDFLVMIDESHQTVPQIGGMYEGDRSRKESLVAHGFRLPLAMDNRPLRFDEFIERVPQAIFVSATPGPYEMRVSSRTSSSRSSARPAWSTPRSRCGRRATRSTTCWPRSACARRPASACSSRR